MISEHPSFESPADRDVSIWRYMDLAKFIWILQKKALFFARADQLGDPYEGHYTEPYVESLDHSADLAARHIIVQGIRLLGRQPACDRSHDRNDFLQDITAGAAGSPSQQIAHGRADLRLRVVGARKLPIVLI